MSKMTVIQLLNKIANGEEVPKKIKYNNIDYFWCNQCKIYERFEDDSKDLYNDLDNLNDEVEIIEEDKKIEPLKTLRHSCNFDRHEETLYENEVDLARKITELIDEVNRMER